MPLKENARAHLAGSCSYNVPFLNVFKWKDRVIPLPMGPASYIYFVLEGELRLHTPSGILDYVAGQYSVSAIDAPERGYVLAFSKENDFLSASVTFSPTDVMDVAISLDDDLLENVLLNRLDEEFKAKEDARVLSCLDRLLKASDEPLTAKFMAPQIRKEMLFHVLCGSCGKAFIQGGSKLRPAGEIYKANSWIKRNYREAFRVEDLAGRWNMSVSQFHQKFKSEVGMGPLQCQKRLRLTEARRLMLDENRNVTQAAFDVGYESLSQFTREYRKMFGKAPSEDITNLLKE